MVSLNLLIASGYDQLVQSIDRVATFLVTHHTLHFMQSGSASFSDSLQSLENVMIGTQSLLMVFCDGVDLS